MLHRFIEFVPDNIQEGVLYISMEYCSAIHLCVCGCGNKVVTPFSPTDWKLTFDGKSISLHPSIGNWNFDCQSHYWITRGIIYMASSWSTDQISKRRQADMEVKKEYYKSASDEIHTCKGKSKRSLWDRILQFLNL